MNFIENFYFGNISPFDQLTCSKEYKNALHDFNLNNEKLRAQLSESQIELLEKMSDNSGIILTETASENFKYGFRLGVQMLLDSLNDN